MVLKLQANNGELGANNGELDGPSDLGVDGFSTAACASCALPSNYGGGGGFLSSLVLLAERKSLHRASGTPWDVGLVLVLLLFVGHYS
ncbi:hypothetical protein ACSQ67_024376 [Phaseolus vulgaris]